MPPTPKPDPEDEKIKRETDEELDRELEDSFPASDPPEILRDPVKRKKPASRA